MYGQNLGGRPDAPGEPIFTKFCMRVRVPDVFLSFEFQKDRMKNVGAVGGRNFAPPIERHIAYTTACCYRTSRDLLWCYKLLFGLVRVDPDDFFELRSSSTRCHPYRMFKHFCNSSVRPRYNFFAERVVNLWNNLPADRVDFGSFASFKRSVQRIHLSSLIP